MSARILSAVAATLFILTGVAGPSDALARCKSRQGFAVFQCGDRAWFQPPPAGSGAVRAVFWQIGYGNAAINNGDGSSGTGMGPAGVFSGNDSGLWQVRLVDASTLPVIGASGKVPPGALCLGPANWANAGVDGCCDNRNPSGGVFRQDGILNPNFELQTLLHEERFVLTEENRKDFPMAVLLTEETGRHFAVAAVATAPRSEDRPDVRRGHYTLAEVVDGSENPITGRRNIVPWQQVPELELDPGGDGAGRAPRGRETISFQARWRPVVVHSDRSSLPSTALRPAGRGVGVADMGPLVAYTLERVSLLPGMMDEAGLPRPEFLLWERVARTETNEAPLDLHPDSCARVVVHLGKSPSTGRPASMACALGRCGDIGYEIPGPAVCVEGPLLKGARAGS